MTTLELNLLATELASARANASLGASHVDQVRRAATFNPAGINITPLHLAKYHFDEAAKLIDQALGKTPTPPVAPSLDEMIQIAKARSETISPSPAPEKENKGSDSTDAGEGVPPSEITNRQSSIVNHQ